jgi:hypothetical protein
VSTIRRVALLIGQDLGYCRDVLRGVQVFAQGRRDWVFRDAPPTVDVIAWLWSSVKRPESPPPTSAVCPDRNSVSTQNETGNAQMSQWQACRYG